MSWIAVGIGGVALIGGGSALGGNAASKAKKDLKKVANIPGLDIEAATLEALGLQEGNLERATKLASGVGTVDQKQLLAQEEMALPGAAAARQQNLQSILALFSDDADWLSGLQRRGAALGVGSGLGGSQAARIGTLRLSDQEKLQRTSMGTGLLGSLLSGLKISNSPSVQAFLGPSASEVINIRGQERVNRQNLLAQRAGMPGATSIWGNTLTQIGGTLLGGSLMGAAGGGGMGGGAGAANPTPGYLGSRGGAAYYNVPVTRY